MKFEFFSKTSIFFSKMLNGDDNSVSSKRFIMLGSFFCLFVMMVVSFWGIHIDEKLVYCFAGLAGGAAVLNVSESIFSKKDVDK
jgi:hypothetical protein